MVSEHGAFVNNFINPEEIVLSNQQKIIEKNLNIFFELQGEIYASAYAD